MPGREKLPGTLKHSPAKAQRTWPKMHDSAVEEYGKGERAHRVAFASLKHSFEKKGDHREPKETKGPSDPRAAKIGKAARSGTGASFGGVDYRGSTRDELYERARQLDVAGRSEMDKAELARAIARKQ